MFPLCSNRFLKSSSYFLTFSIIFRSLGWQQNVFCSTVCLKFESVFVVYTCVWGLHLFESFRSHQWPMLKLWRYNDCLKRYPRLLMLRLRCIARRFHSCNSFERQIGSLCNEDDESLVRLPRYMQICNLIEKEIKREREREITILVNMVISSAVSCFMQKMKFSQSTIISNMSNVFIRLFQICVFFKKT